MAVALATAASDEAPDTPYTITTDNTTAKAVAEGHLTYPRFPHLSRLVRALGHQARTRRPLVILHTKSPQGDPWNELVDCLAKYRTRHAAQQDQQLPRWLTRRLTYTSDLDWQWVLFDANRDAYPAWDGNGFNYQLVPQHCGPPPHCGAPHGGI